MPYLEFAASIQRHVKAPPIEVAAETVADALRCVFASNRPLENYILDDQGAVRKHIAIFVNDAAIKDRLQQTDQVQDSDKIYVIQALSGG